MLLQGLEDRLRNMSWEIIEYNDWVSRATIKPKVRQIIASHGATSAFYVAHNVQARPEAETNERIDAIWVDTEEWQPAYAFEITGGGSGKSVGKLQDYPYPVTPVIVNRGRSEERAKRRREELPEEIEYLDAQIWDAW